ncbi:MAG: cotH [Myxococcaceae bacterium]|nr:cotH [Myxococcaceae bacterium]
MQIDRARASLVSSWLAGSWLACAALACSSSSKHDPGDGPLIDGGTPLADAASASDARASDGGPLPGNPSGLDSGLTAMVPQVCAPTGGGPFWLVEGSLVSVTLSCQTGRAAAPGAFSIDSLPTGAVFDASTATLTWTPTLSQGAVYELTVRASPWNETGTVKIGVADKFDDPANVPVVDPTKYTEEMGLPVVHLQVDPGISDDAYTPATVLYRGHTYESTQAQYRGTFSKSFPKRSYTLKFTKTDKFNEPVGAGGFHDKRKITLISPFNDNSYVRSRTVFDLWNAMDPQHIQVKSYSAVVFLNGVYWGLYTVMDHVDQYLMEDFGLSQDGNLFKAREHDANYRLTAEHGEMKATLHQGYSKEDGLPVDGDPGAYDDLDALVQWVATSDSTTFLSQIDTKLVRKEYEDWFLLVSYLMCNDSIDKNSYHYHDPALPQSLWHYIPWDMDESLGQDFATERTSATSSAPESGKYSMMNHLFERILAEPSLGGPLRQRYTAMLHGGAFDSASILARFDATAAEVRLSALRDESKWGQQYRNFGPWKMYRDATNDLLTHDQEVQYVRKWITDRYTYVDTMY